MKNKMRKRMLAALALSLLLVACDRELPDNKSGKEVTVRVRLVGVSEGGKEDLTRSVSMKESKKFITPVGEGMLLEMQMEQDTSALRATTSILAGNSYFRVIAFKHDTKTFISYDDFTISGGAVSGSLHVPINDSYDFVCYSYNTDIPLNALNYNQDATMPDTETIPVLQGTKDLLYEKIVDKRVDDVAPELEILLSRLMVRMKVVLDVSYNKWTITGIPGSITLGSVNSGGTVQLTNGVIAPTGTPSLTSWSGSGNQRESNELLVMPKASGSTITVSIPKEAIARQSFSTIPASAASATFTAELKSGYSYRLLVRLHVPIFARSNIYWDINKLTFQPAADDPTQNDDTKAGYQGVFFKWGSLVGISPRGEWFWNTTDLYVPIVNSTLANSTWKATTTSAESWALWTGIPYMDPSRGGTSVNDRSDRWLMDTDQNVYDVYKEFRGDICQYIGATTTDNNLKGYRLPMSCEFGITTLNTSWDDSRDGWVGAASFPAQSPSAADGTANIIGSSVPPDQSFARNTSMDNVIFPASGDRGFNGGTLSSVGSIGQYWTGSAYGTGDGYFMYFRDNRMEPINETYRSLACPIRCVKK